MKKKNFNARLNLNKNVISRLDSGKIAGGNGAISTAQDCIATGIFDGCVITCNCPGGGGGTGTGDPTNATQNFITCLEPCN